MKCAVILVVVSLVLIPPAFGQSQWWGFERRSYYDPLTAGVREPLVAAMALGYGSRVEGQVRKTDPRLIWDIDVGAEMPVFGWESSSVNNQTKRVPEHAIGMGLWIPIDFHLLSDHADNSGPIVNTDYRFGGTFKIEKGLTGERWLAGRLAVGHESTHLGDEFSIVGQRVFPRSFERINVSWEFVDAGVLYENFAGEIPWSVRGGLTRLIRHKSYYDTTPESITESPRGPVTPSKNKVDWYGGFDVEWENVIFKQKWGPYLSGELRWRSIYDYHKADPNTHEDRQASINLIAGIKKSGAVDSVGRASPFIRYYRGVNPHGQFRNQKDYVEYGIGVRLIR
jgi:hypothetical protein